MGKYSYDKKVAENDSLLNAVNDNNKFESVKEPLAMLNGKDDDKSFDQLVGAVITAALGENGAITTAISNAITAAIGTGGSIETWADGRYEAKSA